MSNLYSINSPLWNLTNKILHFLWLSILWGICCVPIFTIGTSTTALYCVTLKYARNEEGYITSTFFQSFKQNFKQATIIWLLISLVGIVLGFEFIMYNRWNQIGIIPLVLTTFFLSLFILFIFITIFIFPILAKFDNTVRHTVINAFIMAVCNLPSGISMLLISLAILAIGFLIFPPLLFVAPALIAYINSKFLIKAFDRYISNTENSVKRGSYL